jgi:hypothetical protein
MSKVDICYIASNGFSVRMITQTDLLGKLSAARNRVALICPDKHDPELVSYCARHNVLLEEFDEKNSFDSENYMFKRKYFLEDIRANVALMEKHVVSTRFAKSKHPLRRIRPYYYWLLHRLIPVFPFIRKRFIKREKYYLRSTKAEQIIKKLQPLKLISTYPVNFNEAVLLYYGNRNPGTETWIHLLSWDNITCKGKWPEIADKFIAWGPIMKLELEQFYGIKPSNIYVCGVPHFDLHLQTGKEIPTEYLIALGLDPKRPYLFFAMSSPRFAPGEIDIVEWLVTHLKKEEFGQLQMIIRPHPQNVTGNLADRSWISRLHALIDPGRIAVDFPDLVKSKISYNLERKDMIRLSHLLSGAAMVLNSGSTITIDALFHQKPVIITSFDGHLVFDYWKSARRLTDYPHLKKLVSYGGIIRAGNYDELTSAIRSFLNDPLLKHNERLKTLAMECEVDPDISATDKVVKTLTT